VDAIFVFKQRFLVCDKHLLLEYAHHSIPYVIPCEVAICPGQLLPIVAVCLAKVLTQTRALEKLKRSLLVEGAGLFDDSVLKVLAAVERLLE
jgi:hypothetical protein